MPTMVLHDSGIAVVEEHPVARRPLWLICSAGPSASRRCSHLFSFLKLQCADVTSGEWNVNGSPSAVDDVQVQCQCLRDPRLVSGHTAAHACTQIPPLSSWVSGWQVDLM